MSTSGFQNFP